MIGCYWTVPGYSWSSPGASPGNLSKLLACHLDDEDEYSTCPFVVVSRIVLILNTSPVIVSNSCYGRPRIFEAVPYDYLRVS